MPSTWQLSVSFSPKGPRPTIWEGSRTASTSKPAQAVWSDSRPRWVPTLTNTWGHGSFRSLPAPTLLRPEQCRSTRPRSHASGLSSARRPVCDHGPLPQADHEPLPQRADAPTDTDSHRHCAAVPLHRLPARGHLVPWVPARRLPAGHVRAARLEADSLPGAYSPRACAGASARFRGNLVLVFRGRFQAVVARPGD